ncbi:MAG: UDP-3-O-acyl-N-acetylglucosamine deacetylase, partial [Armatimonadetes bacterium]|nr:UDP-3-O-acyl-N-acetylglucosamine deacetylase [Armatimonadota bacterium]
ACIAAAGITDLLVEVDGPELPFGDGSAMLWEMALPGTRPFGEPIEPVVVSEPVFLHDIDRGQFLVALPADAATWRMTYILDWAHPLVGTQVARFTWAQDSFRDELAAARTFALEEDAKRAKSEGLFPGGTEDSLVLVRPGEVSPDPGRPDAFARHKLMDLMGDLYLMGRPVRGIFAGYNSGHRLNHQLVARLSAQNA